MLSHQPEGWNVHSPIFCKGGKASFVWNTRFPPFTCQLLGYTRQVENGFAILLSAAGRRVEKNLTKKDTRGSISDAHACHVRQTGTNLSAECQKSENSECSPFGTRRPKLMRVLHIRVILTCWAGKLSKLPNSPAAGWALKAYRMQYMWRLARGGRSQGSRRLGKCTRNLSHRHPPLCHLLPRNRANVSHKHLSPGIDLDHHSTRKDVEH